MAAVTVVTVVTVVVVVGAGQPLNPLGHALLSSNGVQILNEFVQGPLPALQSLQSAKLPIVVVVSVTVVGVEVDVVVVAVVAVVNVAVAVVVVVDVVVDVVSLPS